jgi:hypothetical protein
VGTVQRWSGQEARALRESLRMSLRAFAAELGFSERTVAKMEAGGAGYHPYTEMQGALDTMLARAPDEARRRFQRTIGETPDGVADMRADDLGTEPSLPRFASQGTPSYHERIDGQPGLPLAPRAVVTAAENILVTAPAIDSPPDDRAGSELAVTVRTRVDQLRAAEDVVEGSLLLEWVVHDFRWLRMIMDRSMCDPATELHLMAARAGLGQFAGCVAFDHGRHDLAQDYWLDALTAARRVGDRRLSAYVLSWMSYQAVWRGASESALRLIDLANEQLRHQPDVRLQALLATRKSRAHAVLGNRPECERAIDEAAELGAATASANTWIGWLSPVVIRGDSGRALLELGELRRAEPRLAEAVEQLGCDRPRTRMLHWASLAEARAELGDAAGAVDAASAAVELAAETGFRLGGERLRSVQRLLTSNPSGRAHQVARRIDAVLTGAGER